MSWSAPDDPTPDSAIAAAAGTVQPAGHLGPGDLAPDEERLLAALERDTGGDVLVTDPETPAWWRAGERAWPRQPQGGPPDDGLNPLFRSPGEP